MATIGDSIFDVATLQYLYYERSKVWSNFFEKTNSNHKDEEISLKDFDKLFVNEDESDNDLASIEDPNCVDDNVNDLKELQEIGDNIAFRTRSKLAGSKAEKNDGGSKNELEDFVNQTLPILNAYSRHLKESGIENVLNTFDVDKIEEKVGTWLKNNTFIEISNTSTEVCLPNESKLIENGQIDDIQAKPNVEDGSESNESLHSGDTARYIRSSRSKRSKTFKNISNNTIIKTYRTVKSKRDALKEKYNDENICEPVLFKSNNRLRKNYGNSDETDNDNQSRLDAKTRASNNCLKYNGEKRKALRKRPSNNSYSDSDSNATDSDCYDMSKNCPPGRLNRIRKRHLTLVSPITLSHCHKYDECIVLGPHRSTTWLSPLSMHCHSPRRHSRCKSIYPRKPIRLESECHCFHEQKLCNQFSHISDTSTEEWAVDNSILEDADKRINKKRAYKRAKDAITKRNLAEQNCKLERQYKCLATPNRSNGFSEAMDKLSKNQKNHYNKKANAKQIRKRQNSSNDSVIGVELLHNSAGMESNMQSSKLRNTSKQAKLQSNNANEFVNSKNDPEETVEKEFFENLNMIGNSTALSHGNFANGRRFIRSSKHKNNNKKFQSNDEQLNKNCKKTDLTTCASIIADNATDADDDADTIKAKVTNTPSNGNNCSNAAAIELHNSGKTATSANSTDKNQPSDFKKPILVYTPVKKGCSMSERSNTSNGYINITKEHLIPIIGEQASERFFRYYAGRKQFSMNSNIYFRPPATNRLNVSLSTSGSSDDLELIGECGLLYESS